MCEIYMRACRKGSPFDTSLFSSYLLWFRRFLLSLLPQEYSGWLLLLLLLLRMLLRMLLLIEQSGSTILPLFQHLVLLLNDLQLMLL